MLSVLRDDNGLLYQGLAHGNNDASTCDAVRRFQLWSNASKGTSLVVDGLAGPQTRPEIVRAYMALDDTTLPAGTTILAHGCGEFHPVAAEKGPSAAPPPGASGSSGAGSTDAQARQRNRRVEIFLFEGPIVPAPQTCRKPGCAEYQQWNDTVIEEFDLQTEPSDAGDVVFCLVDAEGKQLVNALVVIEWPDGIRRDHSTNDKGEVRLSGGPDDVFKLIELKPSDDLVANISQATVEATG
jgi:hypothetical protein